MSKSNKLIVCRGGSRDSVFKGAVCFVWSSCFFYVICIYSRRYLLGVSWWWSYGSWIYNYLCNQCLSPLTLWVQTLLKRGVLDTLLCDKDYQLLVAGRWISQGTPVSIISPFKFWTATIFLHAHLQVVYYKCVKFHKNPWKGGLCTL
jgi:hypothetical protein